MSLVAAVRTTRLVVALPALTKAEASFLVSMLSMTLGQLRGDDYRPLVDFTGDEQSVAALLVDFALEPGPAARTGRAP